MRVETVIGPPGSGKTTTLAAAAARYASNGEVPVICSHLSSCRAFKRALDAIGVHGLRVDTLAGQLAAWMRSQYAAAHVSPEMRVGGPGACARILRTAAAGLLDLSWPFLRAAEVDLDLPFMGRPEKFLAEAGVLFRQLRRSRISPDDFERNCASGIITFYGEDGRDARARLSDPDMRARLSRRGREAVRVSEAALSAQRRAERDLIRVLVRLYLEYTTAAQLAEELCEEDVIALGVDWLCADERAAQSLVKKMGAVIIDDAEDAEPALSALLDVLQRAGLAAVVIGAWDDAQIDGLSGRRSALSNVVARIYPRAETIELPPRRVPAQAPQARRFRDEGEESDWIAAAIADLLREGVRPGEIAVLARSVDAASLYWRQLKQRGLPIVAPRPLFEEPQEIHDLLALAAVSGDSYDQEHLLRVLASPLVGCSDATLWALCRDVPDRSQLEFEIAVRGTRRPKNGQSLARDALAQNVLENKIDDLLPIHIRQTLERFRECLARWQEGARNLAPAAMLARLTAEAGFRARWESAAPHRSARLLEDGARIIGTLAALHAAEPALLLRDLIRAIEDGSATLPESKRSLDAIACEAISDVKGERWPHAFVAGIAHERFPRVYVPRGMAFTRNYGLIVRENVGGGPAQTAKFAWYYAKFDAKALYIKEERRVLRYALSRADSTAAATGYGKPPAWAAEHDLMADLMSGSP